MRSIESKIISLGELGPKVRKIRQSNPDQIIVATNGCFDILHIGHVQYLYDSKKLGDFLIVGVNSDASVKNLKGEGRPINTARDRIAVLAALESVDFVVEFDDQDACSFISKCKPDYYTKGGDYRLKSLNPFEVTLLRQLNSKITIIPAITSLSSSKIVEYHNDRMES